jgi:alpha-tubulin suppressor-like RCC1 family protein
VTVEAVGYCWGNGDGGVLGTGAELSVAQPTLVVGGLAFRQIDAGTSHTCGVTVDGDAYCWGRDYRGQLGDGPPPRPEPDAAELTRLSPTKVGGAITFQHISAGSDQHSCGVATGGRVYCWGTNESGALGIGNQSWLRGLRYSMRDLPEAVLSVR